MEQQVKHNYLQLPKSVEPVLSHGLISYLETGFSLHTEASHPWDGKLYIYCQSGWLNAPWSMQRPSMQHLQSASVFGLSDAFTQQARQVVNEYVTIFFKANRALLEAVYLAKTDNRDLHYSIVLREDTDENRDKIFSILDEPEIERFSSKYPIYFQFYPQALKNRIQSVEVVDL